MKLKKIIPVLLLGFLSLELLAQEKKWIWQQIGDEISEFLIGGDKDVKSDLRHLQPASISHVSTFSPTYVAATLIQAALTPVSWSYGEVKGSTEATAKISAESSKKNFEEGNRELRKELEESKKREQELRSRLKDQAEKFIESYDPDTKVGVLEPEFKNYLGQVRSRILASYINLAYASGASLDEAQKATWKLDNKILDFDLAAHLLKQTEDSI